MKTSLAAWFVIAVAACGGGSMGANEGQVSAYRSAALQVSDSVASYQAAAANMTNADQCAAAEQQHQGEVQPILRELPQIAGPLDDAMSSIGQGVGADMECGAAVMQQEMQRHRSTACTSPDMAANRLEAQQHVQTMEQLALHMRMRADEMSTVMHGGTMQGGGRATAPADAGWAMPGGGTMSWADPMPGCAFVNGSYRQSGSPAPATTVVAGS